MGLIEGRGKNYGVEHLLSSESGFLDELLEKRLHLSPERVHFLRDFGSVYVNHKRCLENVQIQRNTYLRVHQNPRRFPTELFQWPEQKVFENESFLILDKPSGLPVPATVDNLKENLSQLLSQTLLHTVHVTHRLDVATSGLIIFAKNKKNQSEINQKLAKSEIRKLYRALVHGENPPLGELIHFMEPSPRAPKTVCKNPQSGWAECRLRILRQKKFSPNFSLTEIELITGRTHQIRSQLAAAGFPIVGDRLYGSALQLAPYEKIGLQAFDLAFDFESENFTFQLAESPWQNPSFPCL